MDFDVYMFPDSFLFFGFVSFFFLAKWFLGSCSTQFTENYLNHFHPLNQLDIFEFNISAN